MREETTLWDYLVSLETRCNISVFMGVACPSPSGEAHIPPNLRMTHEKGHLLKVRHELVVFLHDSERQRLGTTPQIPVFVVMAESSCASSSAAPYYPKVETGWGGYPRVEGLDYVVKTSYNYDTTRIVDTPKAPSVLP
jgi:hypothetical protein